MGLENKITEPPHDLEIADSDPFVVYGNPNTMGDKADNLVAHQIRLGRHMAQNRKHLHTPLGAVLAYDPFFYLHQRAIAPTDKLIEEIVADYHGYHPAIAVRSSAVDEQGKHGVYTTVFVSTKDDLQTTRGRMDAAISTVLQSGLEHGAKMAVIVQPVVGDVYQEHYLLPALAGAIVNFGDQTRLYLVIGMGTQAVAGEQSIQITLNPDLELTQEQLEAALTQLTNAQSLDLRTSAITTIPVTSDLITLARTQIPKLIALVNNYFAVYAERPTDLEFAIAVGSDTADVLQADPVTLRTNDSMPDGEQEAVCTEVAQTKDFVVPGQVAGRGILVLNHEGQEKPETTLQVLTDVNAATRDYAVVITDTFLSRASPDLTLSLMARNPSASPRLEARHCSQARLVIEAQAPSRHSMAVDGIVDTSHIGTGSVHWAQSFRDEGKAFLGLPPKLAATLSDTLHAILGSPTQITDHIAFWPNAIFFVNTDNGVATLRVGVADSTQESQLDIPYPIRDRDVFARWVQELGAEADLIYAGFRDIKLALQLAPIIAFLDHLSQLTLSPLLVRLKLDSTPSQEIKRLAASARIAKGLSEKLETHDNWTGRGRYTREELAQKHTEHPFFPFVILNLIIAYDRKHQKDVRRSKK